MEPSSKKLKTDDGKDIPTRRDEELATMRSFKPELEVGSEFEVVKEQRKHLKYYRYDKKDVKKEAGLYLLEGEQSKVDLCSFLFTLITLQKTRMDPKGFAELDGKSYQWKYEEVLKAPHVWKGVSNSSTDSVVTDKTGKNSNSKDETASAGDLHIRTKDFLKNLLSLDGSKLVLELNEEKEVFVPWIHLKTFDIEGKATTGVFASRDFPAKAAIGFYISHPWLEWSEPWKTTPSADQDAELQIRNFLPNNDEASSYMWFYNDKGFLTACDPIQKKPAQKPSGVQTVPSQRILGMGFHFLNITECENFANVQIDTNGTIKTTKQVKANEQLMMYVEAEE
jgi:hypothetical protein